MWTKIFKNKTKNNQFHDNDYDQDETSHYETPSYCNYLEEFENEERRSRRYSLDSPTIFSMEQQTSGTFC